MVKRLKKVVKKPWWQLSAGQEKETEKIKKTKIRVVGIGGGGGNIVSELSLRVKKASFVAANTDRQALREVKRRVNVFQFGENLTYGLGTGMNPEIAETAAQNEKEKIKKLFQGQDFCVIVACLGGGVGSGAAPIFAKIAKNLGVITLGIFTLPFKFEGEEKMELSKESLKKLKPNFNAISIIPNERIFQILEVSTGSPSKNISLKEALSAMNENLAESLEGLIEAVYQPGLINIDFADLKTILEGRGRLAYLTTVEVQREKGNIEAIKKVLSSPLYPYSIRGAKGLLFNIVGEKKLSLAEVFQISKSISELVNPEAKIIFGISQNKKCRDKIKITLLATGCGHLKILSKKSKKPRRKKRSIKKPPQPKNFPPPKPQLPKIKKKKKIFKKTKTKPRKMKIKIIKEPEKSTTPKAEAETSKDPTLNSKANLSNILPIEKIPAKIRKNALQIKREAEEAEREFLEKEKFWETPAFLRKKIKQ